MTINNLLQFIYYYVVILLSVCIEFVWMGFGRSGFCEKLLEASSMSNRANPSWLQDGCAAGQGHRDANIHLQPTEGTHASAGGCTLWRSDPWSSSLWRTADGFILRSLWGTVFSGSRGRAPLPEHPEKIVMNQP